MTKESRSSCPALILAEGYKNYPPAVCRRGFTPEVIDGDIFADSRCNFVVEDITNFHCQRTTEDEIKITQAPPEILAQPRIIRQKKN